MTEKKRYELIETLYEQHYDELVLSCRGWIGYHSELMPFVEECVQDTFKIALARYQTLITHPDSMGWLLCTCYNRLRNIKHTYYGRATKHAFSADEEMSPELMDPHDSLVAFEEDEVYHDLVGRVYELLLDSEKEVFNKYFLENASLVDVSNRVGKTESAVKSMVYRMRRRLEKNMAPILILLISFALLFQLRITE